MLTYESIYIKSTESIESIYSLGYGVDVLLLLYPEEIYTPFFEVNIGKFDMENSLIDEGGYNFGIEAGLLSFFTDNIGGKIGISYNTSSGELKNKEGNETFDYDIDYDTSDIYLKVGFGLKF
ncbi:hypothetical protein KKB84_07450 [bacterium]|nr:hypothetical protein [bacterium]